MSDDTSTEARLRELLRDPGWYLSPWPDAPGRVRRAARRQRARAAAVTACIAVAIGAAAIPLALPARSAMGTAPTAPGSHASAPPATRQPTRSAHPAQPPRTARHRVVPAVLGMNLPEAEAVIRNAIPGCHLTVRHVKSILPAGTVVSQTPVAGSAVQSGARITLVASSGTG